MRVLLDENFPDPPGFDPSDLDATFDVTPLRTHDRDLVGSRTPDWYLYLVAHHAGYDALVTRDWHQSAQTEEMWVAAQTDVSIITWKKPQDDPVIEWGQLLAYMPALHKLRHEHGPSIFFLPAPTLTADHHVKKASDELGVLAHERGRAREELRREARATTSEWLQDRDLADTYAEILKL